MPERHTLMVEWVIIMSSKELSDLGQTLLGNPLGDELKIDWKKQDLLLKSLSTPISRSALLVVVFSFIVFLAFIFAPTAGWRNVLGFFFILIVFAAVAFVLVVPVLKPELAESDIKTMFIYILDTIQKSSQLPTEIDGETIEDANLEELAQPREHSITLEETVVVSDTINKAKTGK